MSDRETMSQGKQDPKDGAQPPTPPQSLEPTQRPNRGQEAQAGEGGGDRDWRADEEQFESLTATTVGRPADATADERVSEEAQAPASVRGSKIRWGDRIAYWLTAGSGLFIVVLITLVAIFLVTQAIPAIAKDKQSFLFSRGFTVAPTSLAFGIVDLLWVTVVSSVIAMALAVPIAIGIALFITQYAPASVRRPVAYIIDLLAAIPSIIYGIWGIYILAPELAPVQRALYHLGFIPLFKDEGVIRGSIFDAGIVLAIMILPIITAISRDVFDRTPNANIEAAWALGATRWEMIRMTVLPYGRPGVISGSMLGLGRALGETIAVLLILSVPSRDAPFSFSIFNSGQTFASIIGANMKEANGRFVTGAYIAAGLVLFVLTFIVNAAARAIVARRKEFV